MKEFKRYLALGLSAVMLVSSLTACGSSSGTSTETEAEETTTTTTAEGNYLASEYTESGLVYNGDICEEIFGMPADTVVATVDGQEVTLVELTYWMAYDAYVLAYYSYGTMDAITWDDEYDEDVTLGEFVKEDALDYALNYLVLKNNALALGLELTEDEIAEVEALVDAYIESYGEALWESAVEAGTINEDDYDDDAYAAWVTAAGTDDFYNELAIYATTIDFFYYLNEVNYYYYNLMEYYFGEGGEYYPTDEDLALYAEDEGYYTAQSILFMYLEDENGDSIAYADMDDDQKAELKAKAQAALDDILSSEDPDATFEAYQELSDDTGSNVAGTYYTFQDGDMVDEYFEGVAALEIGEMGTELIESEDYGYFIVKRLAVPGESVPTLYAYYGYTDYTVAYLYSVDAFGTLMTEWTNNAIEIAETNDNFAALDMSAFTTNLLIVSETLYPSDSEE